MIVLLTCTITYEVYTLHVLFPISSFVKAGCYSSWFDLFQITQSHLRTHFAIPPQLKISLNLSEKSAKKPVGLPLNSFGPPLGEFLRTPPTSRHGFS